MALSFAYNFTGCEISRPVKMKGLYNKSIYILHSDGNLSFTGILNSVVEMTHNKEVKSQPMTSEETLKSAIERVQISRKETKADFYVSMEGGMDCDSFGAFLTWYVCVGNDSGEISIAGGGRMPLPETIYDELSRNKEIELGDIMDRITREENVKQKGGSTAVFTGNRIQRKDVLPYRIIRGSIYYFIGRFFNHACMGW